LEVADVSKSTGLPNNTHCTDAAFAELVKQLHKTTEQLKRTEERVEELTAALERAQEGE
jgi:hypothetical protein